LVLKSPQAKCPGKKVHFETLFCKKKISGSSMILYKKVSGKKVLA